MVGPDGAGGPYRQSRHGWIVSTGAAGARLLAPADLLEGIRHFLFFINKHGQTIKSLCRCQQDRAVNMASARLRSGKTRLQDGEYDRRSGIVWHRQGFGKGLTMVFLLRKLRMDTGLRRFKVILITDRKDLQRQLSDTALTGDVAEVACNA